MPLSIIDDIELRIAGLSWRESLRLPSTFDLVIDVGNPTIRESLWRLPALLGIVEDRRVGAFEIRCADSPTRSFLAAACSRRAQRPSVGDRVRVLLRQNTRRAPRFRAHASTPTIVVTSQPRPERHQHAWLDWIDGVRLAGFDVAAARPELRVPTSAMNEARRLVRQWTGVLGGTLIAFSASKSSSSWPRENFFRLARCLRQRLGATCVSLDAVLGDAEVLPLAATDPWLLAGVLSLCAVCVGDDTDAAHLAAAVRTPVVAIHGETDPTRVGPASETATAFSRTSCACARSSPLGLCAKCVPVDEVLSAIESYAAERWPWDRVQQMFGRP